MTKQPFVFKQRKVVNNYFATLAFFKGVFRTPAST